MELIIDFSDYSVFKLSKPIKNRMGAVEACGRCNHIIGSAEDWINNPSNNPTYYDADEDSPTYGKSVTVFTPEEVMNRLKTIEGPIKSGRNYGGEIYKHEKYLTNYCKPCYDYIHEHPESVQVLAN